MQRNATQVDSERREMLRTMLLQLREHTCQRIKDFRREQSQESEFSPGDYVDVAQSSADVETHAGLIARAEEKLKYLDEAISRLEAGTYGTCAGLPPAHSDRTPHCGPLRALLPILPTETKAVGGYLEPRRNHRSLRSAVDAA